MVFINDAYKQDSLPLEYMEGFVKMMAPITPHIAEELWSKLGHVGTLTYASWPTYEESKLVDDSVQIVVQVNGKVRQRLDIARDTSRDQMQEMALADEKVKEELADKEVKKVIAVPNKLVNIVVGK